MKYTRVKRTRRSRHTRSGGGGHVQRTRKTTSIKQTATSGGRNYYK